MPPTPSRRRALPAALLAAALAVVVGLGGLIGPIGPAGGTAAAAPGDPNEIVALYLEGVGNGHGRGMSQWGAYGRAVEGQNWQQILDAYYGGTTTGDAANVPITVRLLGADGQSTIGVTAESVSLRWSSASTPASGTYRSLTVQQVGANTYKVMGSTAGACLGGSALVVPDGPLSLGARGATVTQLQQVLQRLGHNPGPIDGVFGNLTNGAVSAFQLSQGLPVTAVWTAAEAARARTLLSTSDQGAGWVELGTVTGPVVLTSDNDSSAANPGSLIGLCSPAGVVTHYRGSLSVINDAGTARVINTVMLEDYLRGVVPREVSASWGTAAGGAGMNALRAQAVAARSYALSQNRYSYARTCDSTACQAYGGAARRASAGGAATTLEAPTTDQAIAETAGKVRYRNGAIVSTEYSASNGPRTAGGAFPAIDDPYDAVAANPNHRWARILDAREVAARYGLGRITGAGVEPDPSLTRQGFSGIWANRPVLRGSTTATPTAWTFRGTYDLPSPGFTITPITRSMYDNAGFAFIGDSIGVSIASGPGAIMPPIFDSMFASSRYDVLGARCARGTCVGGNDGVAAARTVPAGTGFAIVQLGYNDATLDAARIDAVMNELRARGVARVAWVNMSERSTGRNYPTGNRALAAATARWPELQIWDWNAASSGSERNRWFSDGIHLTATGRAEFTLWLRNQTLAAFGAGPAPANPSNPTNPTAPTAPPEPPPTVIPNGMARTTIAGADRYATAAQVVASAFSAPVASAVLVSGEDYPDGLAASGFAGTGRLPVLLTRRDALPEATATELARLRAASPSLSVVLAGGTAAISAAVEAQLVAAGYVVDRVEGADRYETAAQLALRQGAAVGTTVVDGVEVRTALLATGQNFPDALSAGAGAYFGRLPLLLTRQGALPPATAAALDTLQIGRVIVLGGSAAVSDAVVEQLRASGRRVDRIAGDNRAATATAFAGYLLADRNAGGLALQSGAGCGGVNTALVVDANGFADALAAGALGGLCRSPILLSGSAATTQFLQANSANFAQVTAVGGRVRFA